ncbi:hypothetical protein FIBSPDRAFT_745069 [Athelia psychrophila]|uniref:Uncharacterized protein n=1 Tax=Athelia psychrophila TaxID=1759441 RepID=A0A166HCS2_9AGAM|nr:hypothetical protein FIBSPDRAFT_745069 [Fibularhizoctonia sp. CBS 109695]
MRPTPPPSARNRSATPQGVAHSDLEKFSDQCRLWYFSQDEDAGRKMTQTLANLPPAQRAPYTRLQSSIRSAYHASVNARRHAEFRAHLTATQPGGSLMPHSRADPGGPMAQKERHDRLERFIGTWCTIGMPGTTPFFEGLWAVMRLQVLPEHLGGAGGNKIEWEFDDAVFKETAGKDFMLEAIDVLKGVLGFDELSSLQRSTSTSTQYAAPTPIHARATSQPLLSNDVEEPKVSPATSSLHLKRTRASSDPFLDNVNTNTAPSTSPRPSPSAAVTSVEESLTFDEDVFPEIPRANATFDDSDGEYMRTWTSPNLPNPEFVSLVSLFPAFVTRRPLPRFPISDPRRQADIEQGEDERGEGKQIRFGTGCMWISPKERAEGFQGGWWTRFRLWWRRTFC